MHQDSINFGDKVPRKMCDKSLSLNSTRLKISKFNKPVSQKKIRNLKNRLVWAPSEHNLLKPSGHSPWKFRTASIRITCPSTRKWKKKKFDWLLSCSTAPLCLKTIFFGLDSKMKAQFDWLLSCSSAPPRMEKNIFGFDSKTESDWILTYSTAPLSLENKFWARLEI